MDTVVQIMVIWRGEVLAMIENKSGEFFSTTRFGENFSLWNIRIQYVYLNTLA